MTRRLSFFPVIARISLAILFLLPISWTQAFAQGASLPANRSAVHAGDFSELAKAPPKERAKQNPLERDPDSVAAGGKLFENHCAKCHGGSAEGTQDGPSLRALGVQQATPGALFWLLTNGVVRHGMPVWSKLPEPQRWQIVTYLKSLGASAKHQPRPSARNTLNASR